MFRLVVSKILAFHYFLTVVTVLKIGEQIRDTMCGHTRAKGRAETLLMV